MTAWKEPLRVAQSEADLLTVARAMVGGMSAEAVEPLLRQERPMARKLGPTAMGLLKQTLARGVALELGRRGGWRPSRHLRQGEVVAGRMWQRQPPQPLAFSPWSIALLRWLVASPLAVTTTCQPLSVKGAPTIADQLMMYLACDLALRCDCGGPLAASLAFRQSPLCWIGFPDLLGRGQPPEPDELTGEALDLLVQQGAFLLEALQQDLCRRWIEQERAKRDVVKLERMVALGQCQRAVLERLAAALERSDRRDLLGFALEAAGWLLRHRPGPIYWIRGIAQVGALSARQRAFREAAALLEALQIPARWVEEAQGVRFFDDEYAASQLLLAQWEQVGAEGLAHAQQLVQQIRALDAFVIEQVDGAAAPDQEVRQ